MSEIISEFSWQFQGGYPDVPVAAGVDIEAFKSDPDPFFVTLPFAKVGVRSRNGKPFDRPAADRLVSEVMSKRPEGILGHVEPLERASRYDLPKLRWLGAMIAEDGLVWGKAWVPGYAREVREFLTDAKRANAKVGLSVYGLTGEHGLHDMTLESIDLGHPERLGIPDAAAVPHITSEMYEESEDMGDKELIAELQGQVGEKDTLVSELQGQIGAKDTLIAELQRDADAARAANKLISESADMWANASLNINASGGDLSTVVQELIEKLTSLKANELRDLFKAQVAETVQVEDLRALVAEMSGYDLKSEMTPELARKLITSMPVDSEAAKARVAEIMEQPFVKNIAQKLINEIAGPAGVAGGKGRDFKDEVADKALEAAAARGISI